MKAASIVSGRDLESPSPSRRLSDYSGRVLGEVQDADLDAVRVVVAAASSGNSPSLTATERAAVLRRFAARIRADEAEYVETLLRECAKPLGEARGEVARAISVLEECAEEATRISGHLVPVAGVAGSEDRLAFTLRLPVGVVAAITPFNGALLSPAHKVGAALAAGAPCILKPADATPFSAYRFMRDLLAAGAPPDQYALLISEGPSVPTALVDHPDVGMVSFTGSTAVGLKIRKSLGLRPAILELGGNAPLIVHEDADVEAAAAAAVPGAFGYAGQVCISVQRIYVHQSRYEEFKLRFLEGVSALRVGDPASPDTQVGPLLDQARAEQLQKDVLAAVEGGASLLTKLRREGALMWPAVLENADPAASVVCQEAFGPVVALFAYDDVQEAFDAANGTEYGLQVGMYTSDYTLMHRAMLELNFGGVVFNDTSRYRVDRMPYGGVKASGSGKEGVRYSIEQMTSERLVVLRPAARPVAMDPGTTLGVQ
jgi:acyl-CoA reductase-like NAD-dependent aldehyde dehydrogenase